MQDEDGDTLMQDYPTDDTRPVTGVYHLTCPQIARQLPEAADNMRLFLCVDGENNRIWGGFELAMKSGVIRVENCVDHTDWGQDSVHEHTDAINAEEVPRRQCTDIEPAAFGMCRIDFESSRRGQALHTSGARAQYQGRDDGRHDARLRRMRRTGEVCETVVQQ